MGTEQRESKDIFVLLARHSMYDCTYSYVRVVTTFIVGEIVRFFCVAFREILQQIPWSLVLTKIFHFSFGEIFFDIKFQFQFLVLFLGIWN
jgi:hypothetical protein